MTERDQLAELLEDAEQKACELIGLLSAALRKAERADETNTGRFLDLALAHLQADNNLIDEGITMAIAAHSRAVGAKRAR